MISHDQYITEREGPYPTENNHESVIRNHEFLIKKAKIRSINSQILAFHSTAFGL